MHLKKKKQNPTTLSYTITMLASRLTKLTINLQRYALTCPILLQLVLLILEPVKDQMTYVFILILKSLLL